MSDHVTYRYTPSGLCAIEPSAFGLAFPGFDCTTSQVEMAAPGVAVVHVRGPLTYDGFWFASYGWITASVRAALDSDVHTVIARIHSPGGDVHGAFECARAVRKAARDAGKRLIAFSDSQACSSAYAFASAADEIVITDSATVGSIGVIAAAVETTRADDLMGLRFELITSGAHKADGNPHIELSRSARAAMQRSVDQLATIFFDLVREHRGIDTKDLEAATLIGVRALDARLVDKIESWDSLLARAAQAPDRITLTSASAIARTTTEARMPDNDDKKDDQDDEKSARAALAKSAKNGCKRSAKALKAFDDDPEKKDDDDKKDDKAESTAASTAAIASLETTLRAEREERRALAARLDAADRANFLATRPDLSPELLKSLEGMALEQVKGIVAAIPKPFEPKTPETTRDPARGAESSEFKSTASAGGIGTTFDRASGVQTFGVRLEGAKQ
jgi:ClpP class serine protease